MPDASAGLLDLNSASNAVCQEDVIRPFMKLSQPIVVCSAKAILRSVFCKVTEPLLGDQIA